MGKRNEIDGDLVIPGSLVVMGGFQNSSYSRTVTRLSGAEQKITTVETEVLDRPTYPEVEAVGIQTRYFRSATQPATPTGDDPAGWLFVFPTGSLPVWTSIANFGFDGHIIGAWSPPVRNTGVDGTNGTNGTNGINAKNCLNLDPWFEHPEQFVSTGAGQFEIITDNSAPEGSYVLCSPSGAAAYASEKNYIPIDRAKNYRVRFWAKADTAAATMYMCLMQYQDNAGTPCATNGGRSPYKPSPYTFPDNAWHLFDYSWTSADWQSGMKFVRPDFLLNYYGAAGRVRISGLFVQEDTRIPKYLGTTGTPTSTSSVIIIKGPSGAGTVEAIPGDYVLMTAATVSGWNQGYLRRWNGSSWNELAPADYNEMYMSALDDVLALASETPALIASAGFFGTIFASRISALQIQFKEYVASISDETPAIGTRQVYMGKNPRYPNDATREYEFALQIYMGMIGTEENWVKHFWTKLMANGLIGLVLSGGLMACGPVLSRPGTFWTDRAFSASGGTDTLTFANGLCVSGNLENQIATSPDGIVWTNRMSPFAAGTDIISSGYGDGVYAIGTANGRVAYSTNGTDYTLCSQIIFGGERVEYIAGNSTTLIAGGQRGQIAYSTDGGVSWSYATSPFILDAANAIRGMEFTGTHFIVCTQYYNSKSLNGITWDVQVANSVTDVLSMHYVNGLTLFGGWHGQIWYRTGIEGAWTQISPNPFGTSQVKGFASGDGRVIAYGAAGKISTSETGKAWIGAISPHGTDGNFNSGIFIPSYGRFVVAGYTPTIYNLIMTSDYAEAGGGVVGKEYDAAGEAYKMFDGRYLRSYATLAESMGMSRKKYFEFPSTTAQNVVFNALSPHIPANNSTSIIGRVGNSGTLMIWRFNTTQIEFNNISSQQLVVTDGNVSAIGVDLQFEFISWADIT